MGKSKKSSPNADILSTSVSDFHAHAIGDLLILQQFAEKSTLGFTWADLDGNIIFANSSLCKFLHESRKTIQGSNLLQYYDDLDQHKIKNKVLPAVMSKGSWAGEMDLLAVDGKPIPTIHDIFLIQSPKGEPLYYAAVITDISERKRMEEALLNSNLQLRAAQQSLKMSNQQLRESEAKFRMISEQSLLGIIIIQDGVFKYVNKAMARLSEYPMKEMLKWKHEEFGKLVHPDDQAFTMAQSRKKQAGEKDVITNYQFKAVTRSGKIKWVDLFSKTIKYQKQNAVLVTLIDITERRQAEDALESSLNEKEVLLQEVHHRVKNNMQVITSLLKLQSSKSTDPQIKKVFKEAHNRIIAMSLIHETLHNSGNLASLDFSTYLVKLISNLSQVYKADSRLIQVSVDETLAALSVDDAVPVGLIINELVSNCLKHAFPKGDIGEIKVGIQAAGKKDLELLVSDNGVGIPDKINLKTTKSLGLQLVHSLAVNQLHGKVDISRKGGTRFKIRFKPKSVTELGIKT